MTLVRLLMVAAVTVAAAGCGTGTNGPVAPVLPQPQLNPTVPGGDGPVIVDVRTVDVPDVAVRLEPVTVDDAAKLLGVGPSGEGTFDGRYAAVHADGGIVTFSVARGPAGPMVEHLADAFGFTVGEPITDREWELTLEGAPIVGLTVTVVDDGPVTVALIDAVRVGARTTIPVADRVVVPGDGRGGHVIDCARTSCQVSAHGDPVWVDTFDAAGDRWLTPGVPVRFGDQTVTVHVHENTGR